MIYKPNTFPMAFATAFEKVSASGLFPLQGQGKKKQVQEGVQFHDIVPSFQDPYALLTLLFAKHSNHL